MIPAIKPRHDNMREAARRGFSTATDLADYLVRGGLPFRDAHEVVGKAVAHDLLRGMAGLCRCLGLGSQVVLLSSKGV